MIGEPLNILHVQGSFDLGGKEARIARLMNIWGDRARHSILVGNSRMMSARDAIAPGIDVRFPQDAPPINGAPTPSRLRAIAAYMRDFDLVLTYNWGAMDAVMAHRLFGRMTHAPALIHHEDGFNEDEAHRLKRRRNVFRRIGLGNAHGIVVPSCVLEHIAIRAWRQPTTKVHNIPNGIDVAAYMRPPAPDAIPGLDRSDGRIVVGTLAGLRAVKNLRRLVRIVAPLGERVRLVIIGEGSDRDEIAAEARRLGVTDLLMPGFLPRPQDYIGLFDIFALTSDSEQFPIALVEAMAAGLPVISTDVGDVASMLPHCNRPFLYATRDESGMMAGLRTLVTDADLRARLAASNQSRAREAFDEAAMVDRYARLYDEAAGRRVLSE